MEPLIALIVVTVVLLAAGAAGVRGLSPWVVPLRFGLATMFLMTGLAHFVGMRDELVRMVPPSLPAPGLLVTVTGVMELVGVAGLVYRRTAAWSAGALTVLMLAMFPANVYAAEEHVTTATSDELPYRIAMELVFLAATVAVVAHDRHARTVSVVGAMAEECDGDGPGVEDGDVAVLGHLQHDVCGVRERLGRRGAGAFVLAVGAGDDGAVGEKAAVAIDDGGAVEAGESGERLLIEVLGVDQVVQAGLGSHGRPVELVAEVVAVLGRDDVVEGVAVADDGQDRAPSLGGEDVGGLHDDARRHGHRR